MVKNRFFHIVDGDVYEESHTDLDTALEDMFNLDEDGYNLKSKFRSICQYNFSLYDGRVVDLEELAEECFKERLTMSIKD